MVWTVGKTIDFKERKKVDLPVLSERTESGSLGVWESGSWRLE